MSERIVATDDHYGYWYTGEGIVRCRDCKWCMAYSKIAYCELFAHRMPNNELDGFCAWGERMED